MVMPEEKKKEEESKKSEENETKKTEDAPGEELTDYKKLAEEYLNHWKRTQADFENYKKDQAKAMGQFRKFANLDIILQVLPVLDNFNASLEHVPEDKKDDAWVAGINHIKRQLEDVLKNNGVEEIKVREGDKFNPEAHEAIKGNLTAEDEISNTSNVIKKIVRKGYKIDGKVIRAAKVTVN